MTAILRRLVTILALLQPMLLVQRPIAAQSPGEVESVLEITETRVQAAYADSLAACAKSFGKALEPAVPLAFVGTKELAEVIARENLGLVKLRQPDAEKAAAEAEQLGRQLAAVAYAKYSWADGRFLVALDNWSKNVKLLDMPELASDATLRAVMVHELCHAYDDRRFSLADRLLTADTNDAVMALNAVIEGSAQLQTRKVCAQNGWAEGFAAMREAVGKVPTSVTKQGEALAMLARATASGMQFAYYDGETFVAAVVAADADNGLERSFREPPRDPETIINPAWYLDPAKRPAILYDPEPALDRLEADYDDTWNRVRVKSTAQQLASGLTLLPKEEVEAFLPTVRNVRIVQLNPKRAPQSKAVIGAVLEFDGEASAARWIEMSDRLSKRKDEAMATGRLRIVGSSTTPLTEPDLRGYLQRKQMKLGRSEFEVASIDVQRGRIVVETILSGEPLDDEAHRKLVREMMDAVFAMGEVKPTEDNPARDK